MRQRQRLPRLEEHKHFANAVRIVKRLKKDGHFTVLAGGCVRDGLLGITPSDLDLATSATPEAVEAAFER
ncbi:MAG TPA: CCA tRNA nucleotidyltransferase, partial [Bdellovibrionales bacterium]|nr:CCA tRNA nucleotidyltransferase [Bdellovibrionales bacterium]